MTFDVDPVTRQPTVEVAHEALIRYWPRLRRWVEDDRDGLRIHRHLTDASATWAAHGRDSADLYRGARLQAAGDWAGQHAEDLTAVESAFLADATHRARTARRRRAAAVGALGVLVVVALVAAGLAVAQRHHADRNAAAASSNATRAEANAAVADQHAGEAAAAAAREAAAHTDSEFRGLALQAQSIAATYPDLAMLLAVEAARRLPGTASASRCTPRSSPSRRSAVSSTSGCRRDMQCCAWPRRRPG